MRYDVFSQTKFNNMPKALRDKLNKEVEEFLGKQHVIFDVSKCDHGTEKLKYVKKSAYKRHIVCMCGKVYKNS